MAGDDSYHDEPGSSAMHAALGVKRPRSPRSDASEPEADSESEDTVPVPSDEEVVSSSETDEERRARTLREFLAIKEEIEGDKGTRKDTGKPNKKRPSRTAEQTNATKAEYMAHKGEMASEGDKFDCTTQFATSTRTRWEDRRGHRFDTCLQRIPGCPIKLHIVSFTWADALRADAAAVACADAHNSHKKQRMRKRKRFASNALRRTAGVARGGDAGALERRELLRLRNYVHRVTNRRVRILICPDGCWADALFRTADMPKGQWLAWQHKSTAKAYKRETGKMAWVFNHVLGYTDALVICSVEAEPDRVWVLNGKVLDDHGVRMMQVSKEKATGNILPVPADGTTLPTKHLDELVAALEAECAKVVEGDATALRTWTVEESDARLGKKQAIERAGILAWMRCKHGGVPVPWIDMPRAMQDDDRNLRLLPDGTVVAYPEAQNGKVDLEVLHDWKNLDGSKTTYQFKTPTGMKGRAGFQIDLRTVAGRDETGVQLVSCTYKLGDNDVYVAVIPDAAAAIARGGHVDVWEFPEAALFDRGLLGTRDAPPLAEVSSFKVYRKGCVANAHKHKWTRKFHSCYVHTAYGWLPGDDVDDVEQAYRIELYQREARARANGNGVLPAGLAMELFHDFLVSL